MPLKLGTTLGPYEVTAKIGEGGMGEVYRARDTKLDRDVALKVLPHAFTDDPDRLARFEREAKVLASLNHPNIGHIYGLEEAEGQKALVLELVEGPTLAERIKQGPIPLDEALPIAKQIAEALEAAHERGVIHRDLKPANIKVRTDGTVKVLDFGLAKAFQPDASDPGLSQSPTISLTAAATQMGMVIGTAAYMAPEQAKGRPVDKRADVWAFGVVLYEMLTGARPFAGDDVSETLARVIDREPDWARLPRQCPPVLSNFLRRCLAKNQKERIRDIGDVSLAMSGAFEVSDREEASVASLQFWQRPRPAAAMAAALMASTLLVAMTFLRPGAPVLERTERFTMAPVSLGLSDNTPVPALSLSSDGSVLVYQGVDDGVRGLYRRRMDQLDMAFLRGTEGARGPFISPDGEWTGFQGVGNMLQKVSLSGGSPTNVVVLEDLSFRGGAWRDDGVIVFGTVSSGLWQVHADGGAPEQLTTPTDGDMHLFPSFLPGRTEVLFTVSSTDGPARIALYSQLRGEPWLLIEGQGAKYSSGHLIFSRDDSIWAAPFDKENLEVSGDPFLLVDQASPSGGGTVRFDASFAGTLLYVSVSGVGDQRELVRVDRRGEEEVIPLEPDIYDVVRVSPDGTRIAVDIRGQGLGNDVWVSELARGTRSRVTTAPGLDALPLWSLDGQEIVFTSSRDGPGNQLFRKAADGTGTAQRLGTVDAEDGILRAYGWSPDGRQIIFEFGGSGTGSDIGLLSLSEPEPSWIPLLQSEANEHSPTISPDGEHFAYASDQSGRLEVYIERFPDRGDRRQVSPRGGVHPVWSPRGDELFYRDLSSEFLVAVTFGADFTPSVPEPLFDANPYWLGVRFRRSYDIFPDGDHFLMVKPVTETGNDSERASITVVRHWLGEHRQRTSN